MSQLWQSYPVPAAAVASLPDICCSCGIGSSRWQKVDQDIASIWRDEGCAGWVVALSTDMGTSSGSPSWLVVVRGGSGRRGVHLVGQGGSVC